MTTATTPERRIYWEFIGSRIRLAREERGWSQAELAAKLGLNEEEMREVELGRQTLLEAEQFRRLGESFERGLDFFSDVLLLDGQERFSWRVEEGTPGAAVERLQARAERWVGLLRWLHEWDGRLNAVREGPALLLEPQPDAERAHAMANQLVQQLGLGPIAAERLVEKVEGELGVPVLFVDTDPDGDNPGAEGILSGICHLQDLDVILVNRRRSVGERLFGLAHELFHVLTWDEAVPELIRVARPPDESARTGNRGPREAADHFAATLLLPRHSLDWVGPELAKNADQLCKAAALLRVEPRLLAWYLCETGLSAAVSAAALPAPVPSPDNALPKPFSKDFIGLLHKAVEAPEMSSRKAAKAMAMAGEMRGLAELFLEYDLEPPHLYF